MVKRGEHKRFGWVWLVILAILIILVWAVWKIFFGYTTCDNWSCFNANLKGCDRTSFVGANNKMVFKYTIRGDSGASCRVDVKLLQGELNNQNSVALEGKKMECDLPKSVVMIPESNIGNCHGMLKEGLQDRYIKKLYTYLVQNLGQINLETLNVPKGLRKVNG